MSRSNIKECSMQIPSTDRGRNPFLSQEQMQNIDRLFPHKVLGADVPVEKLREYMGERKVLEILRSYVR